MGGKALNKYGVYTQKKNTEYFNRIGVQLKYGLKMRLNLNSEVVTCYRTKSDHGDLDLLIETPTGRGINWKEFISVVYNPNAINANGGVYSFDYQDFQIDFIPIPKSKWNSALVYFSYDPLGNIMGKTYHKFNLSYGWEGLYYKFRNFNGINSKNILISNDIRKIFEFGGYDYDRYLLGFDTLEDIFKFCISSKYFNADIFQMENLKAIDKKRNRKRGSYHLFLNYIKDNNIIGSNYQFNDNKDSYIDKINDFFPEANLLDTLKKLKEEDAQRKIVSQKFNGDIVMMWLPNLKGKELGAAMSKFKERIGEYYDEFILNSNYDTIREHFMKIYNE